MTPLSLSLRDAQTLILNSQKLQGPKATPLSIIEHLGYVQIDSLSVIERAHHHVIWSRQHSYRPSELDALVQSRKIYEHWAHAAAYLPMRDYRFSLPVKQRFRDTPWFPRDPKLMAMALERIKKEGPLKAKDFTHPQTKSSAWGNGKPAKQALEQLFLEGQLEITRREGFQKVYDLSERVIPADVDTRMPSDAEYSRFLIDRTLRHHGLASLNEICYLQKKDVKTKVANEIKTGCEVGTIVELKVEKKEDRYFALASALTHPTAHDAQLHILSPFDNMIIQRKKLSTFLILIIR